MKKIYIFLMLLTSLFLFISCSNKVTNEIIEIPKNYINNLENIKNKANEVKDINENYNNLIEDFLED